MTNNTIKESQVNENEYDRKKELEEFDNTKLGVKGLIDSGITQIPRIFQHPPETLFDFQKAVRITGDAENIIPVIDMAGTHEEVVQKIRDAASTYGFFQVVNHGVEVSALDRLVGAIRAFFEQPDEEKIKYYNRDSVASGVGYFSNYDLFHSKAASWRDTLQVQLGPKSVDPNAIPNVCRAEVMEWEKEVKKLSARLLSILSEGLGLSADRLSPESYLARINMAGQYYPYCPEPDKTIGIASHSDHGTLTVLLQDDVGGLQVKYNGQWIDLKPVHGALVINVGDLIQMVSNDVYKSGEHRVYANPLPRSRISVPVFFNPAITSDKLYGPLPELVSPENPALYKQFTISDMNAKFLKKELKDKTMTSYFRL
ncbi:1-aminocyclopropane-1-carboxylate oxidase homolog 4-like [Silene latifolia]|uniref:1-aminocyclopropane-1-carboxylate oxidase homolog 4-like n=1 Tax=Silene latifolia TaxID=37657 RepID=UPI003D77D797